MRAQLLHLSGPLRGRTDTPPTEHLLIGTGRHADVAYPADTPGVAPRHASIEFDPRQCAFHLRARDGRVFVNGTEVLEVILEPEDLLELGVDGPKARFRIWVEPGEYCKPVRTMLADATQVAKQSGAFGFIAAFVRDLLTHATLTLKIGFPLALVLLVFGAAYFGSRVARDLPSITKRYEKELLALREQSEESRRAHEALKKELERRAVLVDRLAAENAAVGKVLTVHINGVCLLAGEFGFERERDGKIELLRGADGEPLTGEYTGSGFLASAEGHVITNHHVVEPWWRNEEIARLAKDGFVPRLRWFRAYFPGREPIEIDRGTIRVRQDEIDVAVVRVTVAGVPIVPISDADPRDLRGVHVLVLGYPTGVSALLAKTDAAVAQQIAASAKNLGEVLAALGKQNAIQPLPTQGSLNEVLDKQLIFDASTTHGGSGGPVFGPDGKVIAVTFAVLEGFAGSNFGVPVRFAAELLK